MTGRPIPEVGFSLAGAVSTEGWQFVSPAQNPRKVLVIEPDAATRSLIELALSREGFRPVVASSGEDGLRQLSADRSLPAAVVSEAQLPGADGFALCGRLRADQRTAQVPFILLSSSVSLRQVELATGVGADDFLIKPAFVRDLATLVRLKAGSNPLDSAFRGHGAGLPLPELLRALLSGVRSGKVEIEHGGGELTFRRGRIVEASLRGREGPSVILPILLLADGDYSVRFAPLSEEGSFSVGLEELCKNILPSVWQWRAQAASGLQLSSRLVVDFARFKQVQAEIPDAVFDVIRLLDGHRTVRDCVLDGTLDEVTTLAVVSRLHKLSVLVPWEPSPKSRHAQGLSIASKLFSHRGRANKAASGAVPEGSVQHYEDLGQLLSADETVGPPVSSRTHKALHTAAAVTGALLVALGAAWVVARSGKALFRWGGRSAIAAKMSPAAAPSQSSTSEQSEPSATRPLTAVSPGQARWFEVERSSIGGRKIAPTQLAQSIPDFWLIVGFARWQSGDRDGAEVAARKALELDPRNGGAAVLLGTIHLEAQEPDQAKKELGRYLELEPQGVYADQARQLLEAP